MGSVDIVPRVGGDIKLLLLCLIGLGRRWGQSTGFGSRQPQLGILTGRREYHRESCEAYVRRYHLPSGLGLAVPSFLLFIVRRLWTW